MGGDLHEGVVAFRPLTLGREAVMIGRVTVGEIMPVDRGHYQACFRLLLPEASATSWRPCHDNAAARRLVIAKINDWLNAASLAPMGAMAEAAARSPSDAQHRPEASSRER